jgi:mRNA interferase MazF
VGLKRGDLTTVIVPGDYGKPRPAVVIQSDLFDGIHSVVVLLTSSHQRPDLPLIRYSLIPTESNGLILPTDVMIDKIFTLPRTRAGGKIGHLKKSEMSEITAALALFLALKDGL